jgi:hypothetical protein
MTDVPSKRFRLVWSEENRDRVRNLGKKAAALGLLTQFSHDIADIEHKLTTDPLAAGDPHYELRAAGLTLYHGVFGLLHLYYAVHHASKSVFVKEIAPFPGCGLEQGANDE